MMEKGRRMTETSVDHVCIMIRRWKGDAEFYRELLIERDGIISKLRDKIEELQKLLDEKNKVGD